MMLQIGIYLSQQPHSLFSVREQGFEAPCLPDSARQLPNRLRLIISHHFTASLA